LATAYVERQLPSLEMRSLPLSRFTHVTSEIVGAAIVGDACPKPNDSVQARIAMRRIDTVILERPNR
jgi:hypothetical protein